MNPREDLHPPSLYPLRMGLKLMTLGKGLIGQHLLEEVDTDDGPVELNDEEQVPHDEAKLGKGVVYPEWDSNPHSNGTRV